MIPPQRARLADGRWHFQHGPIDLVIGVDGDTVSADQAIERAWGRFQSILTELVAELPLLRGDVRQVRDGPSGATARRMWNAVQEYRDQFITPMAAVAGSVADEIVVCFRYPGIRRAFVNNGGDIALHLAPQSHWTVGIFGDLSRFDPASSDEDFPLDGRVEIEGGSAVRGVATSGWRGRSHSLGIADCATVLARDAATADAAATVIANAIDVDHAAIVRVPASSLSPDSDLGERRVTRHVPSLPLDLVEIALARGRSKAEDLIERGIVRQAYLQLQGRACIAGHTAAIRPIRVLLEA